MSNITTELGLKVKATPLSTAIEEYIALKDDLKDLKNKLLKQEIEVLMLMKEKKQYNFRYGDLMVEYKYIEEKEKVAIKKF